MAAACHKKTVPVITERKEFPSSPRSTKPAINANTLEFVAAGKTLYEMKCTRCHALKDPGVYPTEKWGSILKTMIPRAKIDNDQAQQVTAYVMANAKK
jgi:cytochrome c5